MKKLIFILVALFSMATADAQNESATSKFTDNWSVSLQGGVITPLSDFFDGHTACTPIVGISVDKYVNPWLGFGIDARTAIGTGTVGHAHNSYTAFDAVNVGGVAKFNLANIFAYNGTRRFFEPVIYTGLGWGHQTAGTYYEGQHLGHYNYMTYRAGAEFNFNLGKKRAWAIVVNPSVVWGDIDNGKLMKSHGGFEVMAGVVYHFKTSNGTHAWTKHSCPEPQTIEVIREVIKPTTTVKTKIVGVDNYLTVQFEKNKADLSDEAKKILDKVPTGKNVDITASTSPEGSTKRNIELQKLRALVVADYLTGRGVHCTIHPAENSRQAVVKIK